MILHIVYIIAVVVSLLIGAFKIDPTRKYRQVIIDILEKVKEVTPDNVDAIIDRIIKGLEAEELDPNSLIAKKLIKEVKDAARKNMYNYINDIMFLKFFII